MHVALLDEAQQYGNIDEFTTLARLPASCMVLWCGDHKQTLGGLRNTNEAKQFRRKLLCRPLGLRCDTDYVQPHYLCDVVSRFTIGPPGSMADRWASYLRGHAAVKALGSKVVNYLERIPEELLPVFKAALAVLLLARCREEVVIPIATTLNEAAGIDGIHRWNLILPSSARVSPTRPSSVCGT